MSATSISQSPVESADTHHLVRIRRFPSSAELSYVLDLLRMARSTGTLMIDLNLGGVGSIRFREEQRIEFNER